MDLSSARWVKSRHSNNGGNCVEICPDFAAVVPVRDSKDPSGPVLLLPVEVFASFVAGVKAGDFGSV
ncbi:DUF397 domain-containing protein [Kitasatospora mediocidica]|uniref:DUF397 domain-containing protein n=1 Tax=Kitasatospora mediocidica TaxID=58352 RepID=UPI0012F96683|nr:DUF397 domain-containing protein [Kitasatospora mediocidica]